MTLNCTRRGLTIHQQFDIGQFLVSWHFWSFYLLTYLFTQNTDSLAALSPDGSSLSRVDTCVLFYTTRSAEIQRRYYVIQPWINSYCKSAGDCGLNELNSVTSLNRVRSLNWKSVCRRLRSLSTCGLVGTLLVIQFDQPLFSFSLSTSLLNREAMTAECRWGKNQRLRVDERWSWWQMWPNVVTNGSKSLEIHQIFAALVLSSYKWVITIWIGAES